MVGKGTEELGMRAGTILDILGPLGNGFPKNPRKSNLIGGVSNSANVRISQKELECENRMYWDIGMSFFLTEEFEKAGEIYLCKPGRCCKNKRNRFRCDPCQ